MRDEQHPGCMFTEDSVRRKSHQPVDVARLLSDVRDGSGPSAARFSSAVVVAAEACWGSFRVVVRV